MNYRKLIYSTLHEDTIDRLKAAANDATLDLDADTDQIDATVTAILGARYSEAAVLGATSILTNAVLSKLRNRNT